jgi:PTH1 family peptidyl-tRNA hydrolase
VSFDVGHIRIRLKGSAGGHNGLKNIEAHLGSQNYIRIKVGVGKKPTPEMDLADFVLGKFPRQDLETLAAVRERVADAVALLLEGKADQAMSLYST